MHNGLLTLALQSAAGLAVVLALFGLFVWMLKRLQQHRHAHGDAHAMRVVQRFGIDAKHSIVEFSHGGRSYLIGISPNSMNTIASFAASDTSRPVTPASAEAAGGEA